MLEPCSVDLARQPPVSHDTGVEDRELTVDGVRWALVEYAPGRGRAGWCSTPHCGFVVSGAIRYEFEDGSEPLIIATGNGFALPPAPGHRGRNDGTEPATLFIIDVLPASDSASTQP